MKVLSTNCIIAESRFLDITATCVAATDRQTSSGPVAAAMLPACSLLGGLEHLQVQDSGLSCIAGYHRFADGFTNHMTSADHC